MPRDVPQVLLIESDSILSEITGFRLELLGLRVHRAATGEEALKTLDAGLPDVIIIDIALPGVDGVELTDRLSNDDRTAGIPILVLSDTADLHEVQRAHAAGADDYLVIPFDPIVLQQKLEGLLQQGAHVA